MSNKSIVCVTGCTGFLASWIVRDLLVKGYTVHGTTRSIAKADFLTKLEGASERLKLFEGCDLLTPNTFEKAIKGCKTVIHTASPYFFVTNDDGYDRLVKPAVEGTKNVLETCDKLKVEKVVLTSSTAASMIKYGTLPDDHVYTEADWCDEQLLANNKNFYSLSKTKAERLAHQLSEKSSFSLSVMNPCIILGPQLPGQNHLNTSCNTLLSYFSLDEIPQFAMHIVDVRDVSEAHVQAAEMPLTWEGWGKRNLLIGSVLLVEDIINILKESKLIPTEMKKKLPVKLNDNIPSAVMGATPPALSLYDVSRSTSDTSKGGLGIKYHSAKEMVESSVETLLLNGFNSNEKYDLNK